MAQRGHRRAATLYRGIVSSPTTFRSTCVAAVGKDDDCMSGGHRQRTSFGTQVPPVCGRLPAFLCNTASTFRTQLTDQISSIDTHRASSEGHIPSTAHVSCPSYCHRSCNSVVALCPRGSPPQQSHAEQQSAGVASMSDFVTGTPARNTPALNAPIATFSMRSATFKCSNYSYGSSVNNPRIEHSLRISRVLNPTHNLVQLRNQIGAQ